MSDPAKYAGKKLLYDPLFASPPDTAIRDTPGRGLRQRNDGVSPDRKRRATAGDADRQTASSYVDNGRA